MMGMMHPKRYRTSNWTRVGFLLCNIINQCINTNSHKKIPNFFLSVVETEYFAAERGCMIEMRARALIESKCDKLALNFITEALRVIRTCTNDHLLRRTISLLQHQSLLEMYFSLLYKFKESYRLKQELEEMEVESAKEFIVNSFATIDANEAKSSKLKSSSTSSIIDSTKRSSNKQTSCAVTRLHKYHGLVSQYALQLILVRMLSGEYGLYLDNIFTALLSEWVRRNKPKDNFDELFQKLINTAVSNAVVYDCCEVLYNMVRILKILSERKNSMWFSKSYYCCCCFFRSIQMNVKQHCEYFALN